MRVDLPLAIDECWDALLADLDAIATPEWSLPTPCPEWNVRDLAAHLGAAQASFQGMPLPSPPADWVNPFTGLDAMTNAGVEARRSWTTEQIVDEIREASARQRAQIASLDEAGWSADTMGPIGPTTQAGLTRLRVFDLFVHLMDLRHALGRPLAPEATPEAAAVAAGWAVDHSGWGAGKKAHLPDGTRVRLALSGAGATTVDVIVSGGRGACVDPEGDTDEIVSGSAVAYLLLTTGREEAAGAAGGVQATGPHAQRLLDTYRMFT